MKRQSKATQNTIDDTETKRRWRARSPPVTSRVSLSSSYDEFRSSDGAAIEIMIYSATFARL